MPLRNFDHIGNAPQFIQVLATDGCTDEVKAAYAALPADVQANLQATILQDYSYAAGELGISSPVPKPGPLEESAEPKYLEGGTVEFDSEENGDADTTPLVLKGKLPEDFPGKTELAEAGINTYAQLRKHGDVTDVDGIGPATAAKIKEALGE